MTTALAVLFAGMALLSLAGMFRTITRIGKPVQTVTTGGYAAVTAFFSLAYAVVFITTAVILLQAS